MTQGRVTRDVLYLISLLAITTLVIMLAFLAGCSKHVERFDKEPRSWTNTYEPNK